LNNRSLPVSAVRSWVQKIEVIAQNELIELKVRNDFLKWLVLLRESRQLRDLGYCYAAELLALFVVGRFTDTGRPAGLSHIRALGQIQLYRPQDLQAVIVQMPLSSHPKFRLWSHNNDSTFGGGAFSSYTCALERLNNSFITSNLFAHKKRH
jgi:hypothetical protein